MKTLRRRPRPRGQRVPMELPSAWFSTSAVQRHCHPSSGLRLQAASRKFPLRLENTPRNGGSFLEISGVDSRALVSKKETSSRHQSLAVLLFFRWFQPIVPVSVPIRESEMSYTKQSLWASLIPIYMGCSVRGRAAAAAATFRRISRAPSHFSLRTSFLASLLPSEAQVTGYKVSQDLISANGLARY